MLCFKKGEEENTCVLLVPRRGIHTQENKVGEGHIIFAFALII